MCLPWATTESAKSPLYVQISSWTPWTPWSFRHVQNSRTKVAEEVGRSQVAQGRQRQGTRIAVVAEWMHRVGPQNNAYFCKHCVSIWAMHLPPFYHYRASLGRPIASIEWSLWRPLCLHSATTATYEPPLRWFFFHCLLCTTCCVTTAVLVAQGTHKGRTATIRQK